MPEIIVVNRDGEERLLKADAGFSLMQAITNSGSGELLALCGGVMSCATCHVYIEEEFSPRLAAVTDDENDILSGMAHRKPTSRLSCQIPITEALTGLRVTIAPED